MSLFKTSPMFDSVEIVREHVHVCSQCSERFVCSIHECTMVNKYAVCSKPECVARWESDDVDDERHAINCICQDCSGSEWNASDEAYPSRAS